MRKVAFEELKNKTIYRVENKKFETPKNGDDQIYFYCKTNFPEIYVMSPKDPGGDVVWVEDIDGDMNDLVGSPILSAEVVSNYKENPAGLSRPEFKNNWDDFRWTFYKLSTKKGSVTIRWYGTSDPYLNNYSTEVDFIRLV